MRASRGLKWKMKTYKLKRSIEQTYFSAIDFEMAASRPYQQLETMHWVSTVQKVRLVHFASMLPKNV